MISYSCNVIIRAQQNLCSVLQTFLRHKLFVCVFYSMVYHSFYLVFFFSCKFFFSKRNKVNNSKQNNNLLRFIPLEFVITGNLRSPREI